MLSLEEGAKLFLKHVERPEVTGGAKPKTAQRYRAVLDKFKAFAREAHVNAWQQVSRRTLEAYCTWLEADDYAYATEYLELTVIKQIITRTRRW